MISFIATLTLTAAPAPAPVLLDARCPDSEWASATSNEIGQGVTLLTMADSDYVYLCLKLPPDSLGTMDLYIEGAGGVQTNLHVSAQTGERTRTADGWPGWEGFNNYRGWYGPPVAFQGMARGADGQLHADFRNSEARELQIGRARFGDGPWKVMLEVHSLGANGSGAATWPAGAANTSSDGWAELKF